MIITDMPHVTTEKQVVDALGYTPAGGQGVNLLIGSKNLANTNIAEEIQIEKYNDFTVVRKNAMNSNGAFQELIQYIFQGYESGGTYTLSFFAKGTGQVNCFFYEGLQVKDIINSSGIHSTAGDGNSTLFLTSEWKRHWVRWTLKDGDTSTPKKVLIRAMSGNDVYACAPKLERGTVTDPVWTPAPEDVVVRSELDALIKRIVALEAEAGITSADSMELPSADVMESDLETASADETTDDTEIN